MSRLRICFETLKTAQRKALSTYLPSGFPNLKATLEYMQLLAKLGADILEIGVPFSDPVADGEKIQNAYYQAIQQGTGLNQTIDCIAQFRQMNSHIPVVLMTYLNPVEIMGTQTFIQKIKSAGIDGVLIVDQPGDVDSSLTEALQESGIDQICLIAPTTSRQRLETITAKARGFIYYITLKGVTGGRQDDLPSNLQQITAMKQQTTTPILAGFGIKDAQTAKIFTLAADGVIIGSAIVEIIQTGKDDSAQIKTQMSNFIGAVRKVL